MNPLRKFFEQLAQEWDRSHPVDREDTINELFHPFDEPLLKSRRVLDIGTGTGALIPILNRRYPNMEIISIDFAHQMCLRASRRTPTASVVQCDVHALPFLNLCFNTIICHNSFPHFRDKPLALKSLKRVLQSPGKLLILHDISRDRVNEIHKNADAEIIHQDLLPKAENLVKLLRELGFELEVTEDIDTHYIIYANL